jgi:hypothetical protein
LSLGEFGLQPARRWADDSSISVLALIGGFFGLVAGRWLALAVNRPAEPS